jgi:hypothetical protein
MKVFTAKSEPCRIDVHTGDMLSDRSQCNSVTADSAGAVAYTVQSPESFCTVLCYLFTGSLFERLLGEKHPVSTAEFASTSNPCLYKLDS